MRNSVLSERETVEYRYKVSPNTAVNEYARPSTGMIATKVKIVTDGTALEMTLIKMSICGTTPIYFNNLRSGDTNSVGGQVTLRTSPLGGEV